MLSDWAAVPLPFRGFCNCRLRSLSSKSRFSAFRALTPSPAVFLERDHHLRRSPQTHPQTHALLLCRQTADPTHARGSAPRGAGDIGASSSIRPLTGRPGPALTFPREDRALTGAQAAPMPRSSGGELGAAHAWVPGRTPERKSHKPASRPKGGRPPPFPRAGCPPHSPQLVLKQTLRPKNLLSRGWDIEKSQRRGLRFPDPTRTCVSQTSPGPWRSPGDDDLAGYGEGDRRARLVNLPGMDTGAFNRTVHVALNYVTGGLSWFR